MIERAVFIGNHTPRRCGLATFTADLAHAIQSEGTVVEVVAINDRPEGYDYEFPVTFTINQECPDDYLRAADFMNLQGFDVASLQHEYGIFGGPAGEMILYTLRNLRMPFVTTLHTVLKRPTLDQRRVLEEIIQLSERVIVMSAQGAKLLRDVHNVEPHKISIIPHGVPNVPLEDKTPHKIKRNLEGRPVLMTFGLISPDKGIETAIRALPAIVDKLPDAIYLIVGETHPNIRRQSGESYRDHLIAVAEELSVSDNVRFVNEFVAQDELVELLLACDVYITPYHKKEQITSGTLAYAIGCGLPVVSTPFWHAEELLDEGRGILVPPHDHLAIATEVLRLFEEPGHMEQTRKAAYEHSRTMIWSKVAADYQEIFRIARAQSANQLRTLASGGSQLPFRGPRVPEMNLGHFNAMTDDVGIFQHATHNIPNRTEGYCVDDNARALLLACELGDSALAIKFIAFIDHALNRENGRFRNFMGYDRTWLESKGSEDSHGRTMWSLGVAVSSGLPKGCRMRATELFVEGLHRTLNFTSPRAWAFTILGCAEFLRSHPDDQHVEGCLETLASQLENCYTLSSHPTWQWFEHVLSYDNGRLPHAMLRAGMVCGNPRWIEVGMESLKWLNTHQVDAGGLFAPIGSEGFFHRGKERAWHDQQPIEAASMVAVSLVAYEITEDPRWREEARRAFDWFLGWNALGIPLIDLETGGCCDGVHPERLNDNQGAESTLAYLLSLTAIRSFSLAPAKERIKIL